MDAVPVMLIINLVITIIIIVMINDYDDHDDFDDLPIGRCPRRVVVRVIQTVC